MREPDGTTRLLLLSRRVSLGESKAGYGRTIPHPEDLGSIPILADIHTAEVFSSKALNHRLALTLDGAKIRGTTKYELQYSTSCSVVHWRWLLKAESVFSSLSVSSDSLGGFKPVRFPVMSTLSLPLSLLSGSTA